MLPPKERFSSRVEDYVRYRPSYPFGVVSLLQKECDLSSDWVIADVGSGPGNLARLFLENGNQVLAIEPNREMREAGERLLGDLPNYRSVAGSAEESGLDPASVDLVTAGQAFHWFDKEAARIEFARILKPSGWVALVWNMRRIDASRFTSRYEALLQSLPEYKEARADRAPEGDLRAFFEPGDMHAATFTYEQRFDLTSFLGRVLSSSYIPQEGPGHEKLIRDLTDLFNQEAEAGEVVFPYHTELCYGRLS